MTGSDLYRVSPGNAGRLHTVRNRGIFILNLNLNLNTTSSSNGTRKAEQTVDVKIIIATHKKYRMPADEMYLPVHVGAVGIETIDGCRRDDEGENISALNPYFCELTGLYWAWKNLEADYIGLVHYRRHFSRHFRSRDLMSAVLKKRDLEKDLGRIKVFVPKKRRYWIESLYSHYEHTHQITHLNVTRSIIGEKYPEYLESYDKAVSCRWGYMFNMMIMEQELFKNYCSWLFDILFEVQKRFGGEGLTPYQSRYCGRISEIIFNVWLLQQVKSGRLKPAEIKEIPIVLMEKVNWRKKGVAFLRAKYLGIKYDDQEPETY